MITSFHAKYFAHELSRAGVRGVDRLGRGLFDACVDLNPYQIEAALFALRSPLSKGVLLADEVGLGKTIEAGLVICKYWAERKQNILVVCPTSLRKQWEIELTKKFNLSFLVLDAKTFKDQKKNGKSNPFRNTQVIICSMHYAAAAGKAEDVKEIAWDLVVIDEAYKLSNAYRQSNRIGQHVRWATEDRKRLLLTATPLQNSLLKLYGLSTLINDRLFGDLESFRTQYINNGGDISGLQDRLSAFCWRTLRSQVIELVRNTAHKLITKPFKPTEQEHKLSEAVQLFKTRGNLCAPVRAKTPAHPLRPKNPGFLSPHSVTGALEIMRDRLLRMRDELLSTKNTEDQDKEEWLDVMGEDLIEEFFENQEDSPEQQIDSDEHRTNYGNIGVHPCSSVVQIKKLRAEIDTKINKRLMDRALEWFSVSRNLKNSLIDLHGLEPYWLTYEWRAA